MTAVPAPYRRSISANELLYFAGARLSPPFAIQILVEGAGEVAPGALAEAVASGSAACPGARLVARGRTWVDSGVAPQVRVVSLEPGTPLEEAPFLRDRLDPSEGPTCEVLLVRSSGATKLVFRALHAVMDGKGALEWTRDVFRALRGEPLAGAAGAESDLELAERLGARARRSPLRFEHASPIGAEGLDDARFVWKRRRFAGTHAGLVAKLAALLASSSAEERLRFMVPVDLRRHVPELRSTANLSLPIFLDVTRGERWDELHARLLGALADRAELALDGAEGMVRRAPVWGLTQAMSLALRKQRKSGKYLGSAILSHLGRIQVSDFSGDGFQATTVCSLPVHAPLSPLSIVAVECEGGVEIALSCPEGSDARAEALLDAIEGELGGADMRRWTGNHTRAEFPRDATIWGLFEAQAARTPDAVALVHDARTTTYAELCAGAGSVARALAARGIGPGATVGLLSDRTEGAIAALLGVLAAGAAYVPIDPNYPDERVAYMLADSGARVCLVEPRHAARLAARFEGEAIALGALDADDANARVTPPSASDLAYVIYTSGSTGRPKGVEIEHRHLVNYVVWAIPAYGVDAQTRFALFTSLSFDLSVTSIFVPLLAGGSLALFPEELDHVTLGRILSGHGVNALKLTPTHLDLLARLDLAPEGFRTVVVGGEQLRGTVAARAQRAFGPACRIVNEYGPTETTVGCVTHVFAAERDAASPAVPIGLPASNVRIYLLDRDRQPVDRGAEGEIYIAGDGVARGYRGRDDLNRERFVALFEGAERAYKTGDVARIDDLGALEFLGRNDDQVKIRGHRIEPGEIEAVLEAHPAVERAVVLARSRAGGGADTKVLCAYVVPREGLDDAELRRFFEARLPAPLVPTFVVRVTTLPLTTNGKVDARALPDPVAATAPRGGSRPPAARSDAERAIAAIWGEILGVAAETLGAEDDFHRLGGDSLQMVQMLSRVAKKLLAGESARERAFMRDAREVIRRPTLDAVRCAAERALTAAAEVA